MNVAYQYNPWTELPHGVELVKLSTHTDDRGSFTELLRKNWLPSFEPTQTNYARSEENVLRGVHLHKSHSDFLIFVEGVAVVALRDLRKKSPTYFNGGLYEFTSKNLQGIFIPPGVAHGFYFPQGGAHIYMVDKYFDGSDEFGCAYNDPALELNWPTIAPKLSPRDKSLGTLTELITQIESW